METPKTCNTQQISPRQQLAVTALALGQNDTMAAAAASVHRSTLNQWKNKNVHFIQALNQERNKIRDANTKLTLDIHKKLKEAAYKTVLAGITAGDLVSARWWIEKSCLEDDNRQVRDIEQQQSQLYEEDIESILGNMAMDNVKEYLDKQGVDQMERYQIEEAMVSKIKSRLIDEYNIRESVSEED